MFIPPRDHDGYITKMEYMQLSDKLTDKQVELSGWDWGKFHLLFFQVSAVFKRNDQDRDGKLSKEEYLMMMKNKK